MQPGWYIRPPSQLPPGLSLGPCRRYRRPCLTGGSAAPPPLSVQFRRPLLWLISPPFRESFSRQDNVTWMYSLKRFNSVLREADGLLQPGGPVIPIDLFEIAQGRPSALCKPCAPAAAAVDGVRALTCRVDLNPDTPGVHLFAG